MNTNEKKHKVLIVDDNISILQLLICTLKNECQIQISKKGYEAINKAIDWNPDIILLDVMLPDINGYDVCEKLKENINTRNIPVIFMTGLSDANNEAKGLAIGAADFITKPFNLLLAKARIMNHLAFKHQRDNLELMVKEKTRIIELTQTNTISCIGSLAEFRSYETGAHINRCKKYVKLLSEKLRQNDKFNKYLDKSTIDLLIKVTPLHDIGKITIPEKILFKPGKLTKEEFEIVKLHTISGDKILSKIAGTELQSSDYLMLARKIAISHHEKWDGSGYPYGLSGENIPLSGRIMAVADVYDALTSKRIYKDAFTHDESFKILVKDRGTAFDPDIIDVMLTLNDEFQDISINNLKQTNIIEGADIFMKYQEQ